MARVLSLIILFGLLLSGAGFAEERTLQYGGVTRQYILHVPAGAPPPNGWPVVFALHGGGSNARQMQRMTGFDALADEKRFMVVYPNSVDKNWNDGRPGSTISTQRTNVDDVGFIVALLDTLKPVDPSRVFATGISNGAMMSHRLAAERADRFVAIAPVVGGLAEPIAQRFNPSHKVSVFILQGTEDPLVPYNGGDILPRLGGGKRGKIISTGDAVALWVKRNGCGPAQTSLLPNVAKDRCLVRVERYPGPRGEDVVLYRIVGGGHTWPGGKQYLPESMIGRVCRDVDATRAIWDFFEAHPRP